MLIIWNKYESKCFSKIEYYGVLKLLGFYLDMKTYRKHGIILVIIKS